MAYLHYMLLEKCWLIGKFCLIIKIDTSYYTNAIRQHGLVNLIVRHIFYFLSIMKF